MIDKNKLTEKQKKEIFELFVPQLDIAIEAFINAMATYFKSDLSKEFLNFNPAKSYLLTMIFTISNIVAKNSKISFDEFLQELAYEIIITNPKRLQEFVKKNKVKTND